MRPEEIGAVRISRQVHAIEDNLDMLLAAAGTLMSEMTQFRVDHDMEAVDGQRAIARVAELQKSLVEARMKAVGAHSDLKKIIETKADFPFTCPERQDLGKPREIGYPAAA